ncbi:MAG: hypothetical protein IPK14_17880 [Blastocatellia bacterium]|nr:hypothetical protein [Blastocatellia bacterium]
MSKLIVLNQSGQLANNLEDKDLLIAYLTGKFSFSEILEIIAIPLIYSSEESLFDFADATNLLAKEMPNNFSILVKKIGYANSLEILFSSNLITSQTAYHLRLINKICSLEEFNQQVSKISKLSLSAIELALNVSQKGIYLSNDRAEILERYAFALRFSHIDQKEGMQAFLEKRPPNFSSNK